MRGIVTSFVFILFTICVSAQERIYKFNYQISKDSVDFVNINDAINAYSLEVRAALDKNDESYGNSKQEWGIKWNYLSNSEYYYAKIRCGNTNYRDFIDRRYADVLIGKVKNGIDSIIDVKRFEKGVNTAIGYNTLLIDVDKESARIFVGSQELNFVSKIRTDSIHGKYGVYANEKLHIMSFASETKKDLQEILLTDWTEDKLNDYLINSSDKLEGYWSYLDRDNNDELAKIGGRYNVALVKTGNEYMILYHSGAVTNGFSWKKGMIKGRLKPTIFENHYDLIWYDSMFEPIENDAFADIIDDVIINLQFPIYKSSFRLYKKK